MIASPSMAMLEQLDANLWVAARPQTFLGLHVGTRMTIVRGDDGGLVVHSPIALDDALRGEVEALGPVRCVIAPNAYHHLYAGAWAAGFAGVRLVGPERLATKRKDLRFDAFLDERPDAAWAGTLEQVRLRGCALHETVFFHRPSRTVISSDLVENFETSPHWGTRLYLKVCGIHGKPGVSRIMKPLFRDRAAARASLEQILAWDFERLVLAHGNLVTARAPDVVRESYAWL